MKYKIYNLEDINLSALHLVKNRDVWYGPQNHSRQVFQTSRWPVWLAKSKMFYKIWNENYVRKDNILNGLEAGFYDENTVPALDGIIFSKGVCRGYVMHACSGKRIYAPEFYNLLKEKTRLTGYFNYQIGINHILQYRDQYSLIDLEGIYPISTCTSLSDYHAYFDDSDYEKFVRSLLAA